MQCLARMRLPRVLTATLIFTLVLLLAVQEARTMAVSKSGNNDMPGNVTDWRPGQPLPDPSCRKMDNGSLSCGTTEQDEILPGSCQYYARRKLGCGKPRSCRDCLELEGCMINQFGMCVNSTWKTPFDPGCSYQFAFENHFVGPNATNAPTSQRYYFPAGNLTYCEKSDETCKACKKTMFAGDVTDSRFCVGEKGCLCIAVCEAGGWEQLAGGKRCGPPPDSKAFSAEKDRKVVLQKDKEDDSGGSKWLQIWTAGGIPVLVIAVGLLVMRSHRKESRRREEALRQLEAVTGSTRGGDPDSDTSARRPGPLNLTGWRSMRTLAIKKDSNDEFAAKSPLSPKQHFVDMLDTQSGTNPDVTLRVAPIMGAQTMQASAPPLSPQHANGVQPSAPSFDSDVAYDDDEANLL